MKNKSAIIVYSILIIGLLAGFLNSCKKDETTNQPPSIPQLIYPAVNAMNVADSSFSWTACTDPDGDKLTYDVFLSTSSTNLPVYSSNLSTTSCKFTLDHTDSINYYWYVLAKDGKGNSTKSALYSFRSKYLPAGPGKPKLIAPVNGATNIDYLNNIGLEWTYSGIQVTTFSVYFGTTNPPALFGIAGSGIFKFMMNPTKLAANTTYYWSVTANSLVGSTSSDLFSFKTAQ